MLKPGTIIGERYEILETVGSGGMSIVYKAKCHKLNRYVAIKMLKPEFSDDKNFVTKFRVEAQSSACLSHPNIVSVYDVGEDDSMHYIVMELVEGITLKEYIARQGHLSVEQMVNFSMQIAAGIEVAHDNHIIHRDIKPQNIIVSRSGTLKVTDFGIARAATSNTISPTAMGSVHYISPEQARGGYSDERSDIYSLGITMFEMLTGKVPFEGENNVTVALMHIQDEMISPRAYYPDIPASLEKIIFKCTQKRAERRYLTANALIADLRKVAANPYADIEVGAMPTYNNEPTVMITPSELDAIKQGAKTTVSQTGVQVPPTQTGVQVPPTQTGVQAPPTQTGVQVPPTQTGVQIPPMQAGMQNSERTSTPKRYEDLVQEDPLDDPIVQKAIAATSYDSRPPQKDDDNRDEIDIDDDLDLDPKLEKLVMVGGILVAILVCIFLMIGISKMTGWFNFGGDKTTEEITTEAASNDSTDESTDAKTYIMINVVGLAQEEAEEKLKDADIDFYIIRYEQSDDVEEGTVISQSVSEGSEVSENDELIIVVSSGTESVEVPDVEGKLAEDAEEILTQAGFETQFAYEYSEDVEKDYVISTDPPAGSDAPKGSKIIITVSNGKELIETTVPDLKNMTVEEAKAALEEAGLELGEVSEEYSDEVEKGKVIRQSTSANTTVASGNKVDITISKGPEEKEVTYTASFSGQITNISYEFAEGEKVTIKLVFRYDGGRVSYNLLEGSYAGAKFPLKLKKIKDITGLATNSGEISLTVINSAGEDISSHFSASGVSVTFTEVTE